MHRIWRRTRMHKGRSLCACESRQRSSQRSTESERDSLTGEVDEGGGRPRELRGEGAGEVSARVTGNKVQEILTLVANGAEGGDNEGNTAEAAVRRGARWSAKIVPCGLSRDGSMGTEAGGGSVEAGEGRRASDIRGLDINQGPGAAAVEVANDNIGLLRQGRAVLKHPLAHSLMATCALCLRDDASVTKGGGEDGGEGITGGVMHRRVKTDAVWALYEVAAVGPMIGGAASKGTGGAYGVGNE